MTKKEYLESIGYERNTWGYYAKETDKYRFCIRIEPDDEYFKIITYDFFYNQQDIDNLQIAFNRLKRGYEECMKYDD